MYIYIVVCWFVSICMFKFKYIYIYLCFVGLYVCMYVCNVCMYVCIRRPRLTQGGARKGRRVYDKNIIIIYIYNLYILLRQ